MDSTSRYATAPRSPYENRRQHDPINAEPDVRHPEVIVTLVGSDGNAFAILGKVVAGLRAGGHTDEDEFTTEAMSGDYDHLLQTCMRWVTVE